MPWSRRCRAAALAERDPAASDVGTPHDSVENLKMEQIRTGASLAIAACIVFGVAQAVRAQGVDHSIGKYLSEPVAQGKAPAMWAAIVNENGIEAIAAAGVRKRGSPAKATIDDQIHIGSLTKAMTSVLLARLVADGVFTNGWRTTIAEVFPELERKMHASYREVTLDELVRHRSGLAHSATNWWAYRDRDIKKRRYRQLKANLRNRPAGIRGDFLYSNLGYMVAGAMAERVTGQSWEELMRKHLFGPLGMNRSGFGVPGTRDEVDEPWGHRRGKTGRWKGAQIDNEASLGPAGTVHLTLGDYAKFARLWFENADPEILNREQLEELATAARRKIRRRVVCGQSILGKRETSSTTPDRTPTGMSWCGLRLTPAKPISRARTRATTKPPTSSTRSSGNSSITRHIWSRFRTAWRRRRSPRHRKPPRPARFQPRSLLRPLRLRRRLWRRRSA